MLEDLAATAYDLEPNLNMFYDWLLYLREKVISIYDWFFRNMINQSQSLFISLGTNLELYYVLCSYMYCTSYVTLK